MKFNFVKKVSLEINGVSLDLLPEQALALKLELDKLFGSGVIAITWATPLPNENYPIVTCTSTSTTI